MTAFINDGHFTRYHYVQSTSNPRYPYGVCGPFASEQEARAALERISAAHLSARLHLEVAGFADDHCDMLSRDQDAARLRLEQLAAA